MRELSRYVLQDSRVKDLSKYVYTINYFLFESGFDRFRCTEKQVRLKTLNDEAWYARHGQQQTTPQTDILNNRTDNFPVS